MTTTLFKNSLEEEFDIQLMFNISTVSIQLSISSISGAHTIGLARCVQFRAHIYNDSNVDPLFRKSLQNKCPRSGNDNVLEPLDYQTPTHFDNLYTSRIY
jgi:peroxidase